MFSLDVFAEVMVVGGLLLLALVPILIRFSDDLEGEGFAPRRRAEHYKTWAEQDASRPAKLKYAEFLLRERNEATAAWLYRHKSFIRILRGASAASAPSPFDH